MNDEFPLNHFFNDVTPQNNKVIPQHHQLPASSKVASAIAQDLEELELLRQGILGQFAQEVSPSKYEAFFRDGFAILSIDFNKIRVQCVTPFILNLLETKYGQALQSAIAQTLGRTPEIEYSLLSSSAPEQDKRPYTVHRGSTVKETRFTIEDLEPTHQDKMNTIESTFIEHVQNPLGITVDTRKTFESFIVGPSNNLAHASAIAVANKPGKVYSSIYLHGNSGLGKTHLLHAIANKIHSHNPKLKICLTTANDFMSEMVKSMQANNLGSFRKRYAEEIDVLMIDDIHELKNRPGTQNEFFHVFNQLTRQEKQLVFTSDKHPREIHGIEDRIRTRLSSALVVEIQQPDLETRIAILKAKAEEEDIFVPDDVIHLIANSIKSNIRELEGSLIKLGAYSSLFNVDIDLDIAKEQLRIEDHSEFDSLSIESIAKTVAGHFKIPVPDLRSKGRSKEITHARHIAMYLCYRIKKATLVEIGSYFGRRDHTSVMHAVKKIKSSLKDDQSLVQEIYEIENKI